MAGANKAIVIFVNNKWELEWRPGVTVREVLTDLSFTHTVVVVSVNGLLVPSADYDTHPVADGDSVKVIHIIGGG